MALNTLKELKTLLGLQERQNAEIMTVVARNTATGVITVENRKGARIKFSSTYQLRDRLIISGGNIIGRAESTLLTVWVD